VKRAVVAILAAIGGLMLLGFLFLLAMSWALLSPTPLPDQIVLELDLDRGVVETVPQDPLLMALERRRLTTRDLVEGLDRAAGDRRVVGILVRGSGGVGGWARTEELREAVLRFAESGKPSVFFAETFGEMGPGQATFYLASAFDEVILQPSGDVGLMPLQAEAPFVREMLEKLDVEPRFGARGEYKDAVDIFARTGFSEPSREALETLLGSILTSLVEGVSEGRGLSADSVRSLVAAGPFMGPEARDAGLVDRLGYLDEARDRAVEVTESEASRFGFEQYLDRGGRAWDRGPRVALIYGVGPVVRGEGGYDPLTGSVAFAASTVARHIRQAVEDDRVRAIVFRVESPGGSYVASDLVRRELARARADGKPVVVSMGNTAASGGYLVSTDADRIVAHPSTITGSIGVAGGKMVTRELWERLGVDWDRVQVGGESTLYSTLDDFTDEEWERFQAQLDRVYEEFVGLVADGRGMERQAVDEAARGRVWSGRDALEQGLVDELGGFHVALAGVRELLDIAPDAPIHLVRYPAERTFLQLLLEDGWRVGAATLLLEGASSSALLTALEPAVRRAAALGLLGEPPGPTRMPHLEVPSP
jgi:protease IV